jgi:hypothetical protein
MNPLYEDVRDRALFWVGWEANKNVPGDYGNGPGKKYNADTKLSKIGISAALKADLSGKTNVEFRKTFGEGWSRVGPHDTMDCITIGSYLTLICEHAPAVYNTYKVEMLTVLGKAAGIDVVNDYGSGKKYNADTEMPTLISGAAAKKKLLLGANEGFRDSFLDEWADFVAQDVEDFETIGDYISAVCEHCPIGKLPSGEPT